MNIRTFVDRMRRRWVGSRIAQRELAELLEAFEVSHSEDAIESTRLTESDWLVHATITRWRADDA